MVHTLASAQEWSWVNKVGIGGQNRSAGVVKSTTDLDGNTYAVVDYETSIIVGGKEYPAPNFYGSYFVIIKFNNRGNVVWSSGFHGEAGWDDRFSVDNIAVDKTGRVYVTGSFKDKSTFENGIQLTIPKEYDIYDKLELGFICAYSNDGVATWAKFGGNILVADDEIIYCLTKLIDGFSTYTQWNDYLAQHQFDSIRCYNHNAQLVRRILRPSFSQQYDNQYETLILDGNDVWLKEYQYPGAVFLKYDAAKDEFDEIATMPAWSNYLTIYKNAVYFLGCFPYEGGTLQFDNISLTAPAPKFLYDSWGFLVKYDLLTKQFVWGRTVAQMDCGFNPLLLASPTDVLYLSTERGNTDTENSIRAYSLDGDSLWTKTSSSFIINNNSLGTDRYGNVYVSGDVSNGLNTYASFGTLGFRYDYSVGFVAKISLHPDAPKLVGKTPLNENNVSTTTTLQLAFSEDVTLGTGSVHIFNSTTNSKITSLPLSSNATQITGPNVVINLVEPLPEGTTVYVQVDKGTFYNVQGNAFSGIQDKSWLFTTRTYDKTPPILIASLPTNGAIGVDPNTTLIATFNEHIVLRDNGVLTLFEKGTDAVVLTLGLTQQNTVVDKNILSVTLPQSLPQGTQLYVTISPNSIADTSKNMYLGITDNRWSFSTRKDGLVTGSEDLTVRSIMLYPNPVDDNLTVFSNDEQQVLELGIENCFGQHLITVIINKPDTTIDLSTLPAGVYVVTIHNAGTSVVKQKIIKR